MRRFAIVGRPGSGKTTLMERLLPWLTARGLRVSTLQHCCRSPELDQPGKDSARHRRAGAVVVGLAAPNRWVLVRANGDALPTPEEAFAVLAPVDLVLIEGYRGLICPALEVWRPAVAAEPLAAGDPAILAIATDAPGEPRLLRLGTPVLPLGDLGALADLVMGGTGLGPAGRA